MGGGANPFLDQTRSCYRRLVISYKDHVPVRRFAERSKQSLGNMMSSYTWSRNGSSGGGTISQELIRMCLFVSGN